MEEIEKTTIMEDSTDDEKIDIVAKEILEKYREAFEKLAE